LLSVSRALGWIPSTAKIYKKENNEVMKRFLKRENISRKGKSQYPKPY
jgi:hypothetical protein